MFDEGDPNRWGPVGGVAFVLTVGLLLGAVGVVPVAATSTPTPTPTATPTPTPTPTPTATPTPTPTATPTPTPTATPTPTPTATPVETIDSCTVINDSNVPADGVVHVGSDLTTDGASPCIEVKTSDVTVDGQGHLVSGAGSGVAVAVNNSSQPPANVTVRDLDVGGWDTGVRYDRVDGGAVENVAAGEVTNGVVLTAVQSVDVDGVVTEPTGVGVVLADAVGSRVANVTVSKAGRTGVLLVDGDDNAVVDSRVEHADRGVVARSATETTVERTVVEATRGDGVALVDGAYRSTVRDTTVLRPGGTGVSVRRSFEATIDNVTVQDAGRDGIAVSRGRERILAATEPTASASAEDGPVTTVRDSTVTGASGDGVVLTGANYVPVSVVVDNATVREVGGDGIAVRNQEREFDEPIRRIEASTRDVSLGPTVTVTDSTVTDASRSGVRLERLYEFPVTVSGTTVEDSGMMGISATEVPSATVEDNVVRGNGHTGDDSDLIGLDQGGLRIDTVDAVVVGNDVSENAGVGAAILPSGRPAPDSGVTVRNTNLDRNEQHGLIVGHPNVTVDGVTADGNGAAGIGVDTSLGAETDGDGEIRDSDARNNDGPGVVVYGSDTTLDDVTVADNGDPESDREIGGFRTADLGVYGTANVTNFTVGETTIATGSLGSVGVSEAASVPAAPAGMADVGVAFEGTSPDDLVRVESTNEVGTADMGTTAASESHADVSVRYTQSAADAPPVNESTLALYRHGGENWSRVPGGSADPVANTVSANVTSFSVVAPLGEIDDPPEANLTASSREIRAGENVTFDAGESVDPDSTIDGYEWDFDGDGTFETSTSGPTVERSFRDVGTRRVTVRVTADGRNDTAGLTLTVAPPPSGGNNVGEVGTIDSNFRVSDASTSNSRVAPGDSVTVTVTVRNGGNAGGTETVGLVADGQRVDSETVRLSAGESTRLTFTRTFESAGEYTLAVGGERVDTLVVGAVDTATDTASGTSPTRTDTSTTAVQATDGSEPSPTTGDGSGFGPGVAVAALVASAAELARRHRRR